MKKLLVCFLSFSLCFALPMQGHADEDNIYDEITGISATDATNAGIGISMMGWGLAIVVGITILALVIHQSTATTAHSSSS